MKLIKCYISAFGKLSNFEYNFNDNLNVINEQNGWGKSTFATFIKCMFYGLNDKKKSILENERKKYAPWNNSDNFGGYVIFERDGNQFKIERFFGKKPIDDTVNLIDVKTGKIYPKQEDLGKRLFGVDEEGFLFSTYLSQNNFEIKTNATLTAKYNNTYEIQDANLFVKALDKLSLKAKALQTRGEKGEIFDIKRQIHQIKEKLEFSKNARIELDDSNNKLLKLDEVIEKIKTEILVCNENLSKIKSVVEYNYALDKRDKLFKSLKDLEEKKRLCLEFLGDNVIKAERVDEYISVLEDYNKTLSAVNIISQDLISLREKSSSDNANKKPFNKKILIILPVLLALSSLFFFISTTLGAVALGVGVLLCAGIIFFTHNKSAKSIVNPYDEIVLNKETELNEFNEIKHKYEIAIKEYLSIFNLTDLDYKSALDKIKTVCHEYKMILTDIKAVEDEIKNTAIDTSIDKKSLNINADETAFRVRELNSVLSIRERERGDLIAGIKSLEDKIDGIIDLETQLSVLEERLASCKEEFEAISYAIEYLTKADENIKVKYREPLEMSLNKFLSYLNMGYTVNIDVDLNVSILENGALKSTEYYSEGLKNVFDLCKRFAIIDVLFSKEKPFIILDDPFSNFDKERINVALNLLDKLKDEYQILYLVCHESRC